MSTITSRGIVADTIAFGLKGTTYSASEVDAAWQRAWQAVGRPAASLYARLTSGPVSLGTDVLNDYSLEVVLGWCNEPAAA